MCQVYLLFCCELWELMYICVVSDERADQSFVKYFVRPIFFSIMSLWMIWVRSFMTEILLIGLMQMRTVIVSVQKFIVFCINLHDMFVVMSQNDDTQVIAIFSSDVRCLSIFHVLVVLMLIRQGWSSAVLMGSLFIVWFLLVLIVPRRIICV